MKPSLLLALTLSLALAGCASTSPEADALLKKGLDEAEAGQVADAMRTLQKAAAQYPGNLRVRFELARLQYETGESFHLQERKDMRAAAVYLERGQREEAMANRRKGSELRARATPYYRSARKNLQAVVDGESDDRRIAWASYLLMRCDVFFEDWEQANQDLDRAIRLGKPTGRLLAQWRGFQAGIRDKLGPEPGDD